MIIDPHAELKVMLERVRVLSKNEMKYLTKSQVLLMVIEEFGELATEIKIEQKMFGAGHKQVKEGSAGESVDLFITAAAVLFAVEPNLNLETSNCWDYEVNTYEPFALMGEVTEHLPNMTTSTYSCCAVMLLAMFLFCSTKGNEPESFIEFASYVNKKLDKWTANQNAELATK